MRRIVAVALLILPLLLALAAVPAVPAEAQPGTRLFLPLIARPAALAFVSDRDSGTRIEELAADGTGARSLTNPTTNDRQPVPSPDGRTIAFFSTREGRDGLYLMNRDGSGQRRLADCNVCQRASWLPDGRRLLLFSLEQRANVVGGQANAITLVDSAGSPPIALPDGSLVAPDGSAAAYVTTTQDGSTLLVQPTTGGPPRTLSSGPSWISNLAWSPDSSVLAFDSVGGGTTSVFTTALDGQPPRRLADGSNAVWSPDGRLLAYTARVLVSETLFRSVVFVVGRDNGTPLRIAEGGATGLMSLGSSPVWSPDGRQLAFLSYDDQGFLGRLRVSDADGNNQFTLPGVVFNFYGWSPDSTQLAVLTRGDEGEAIALFDRRGVQNAAVPIRDRPTGLRWSPDSSSLVTVRADGTSGVSGVFDTLFTFRRDGSALRQLDNADNPRWTPDNQLLLARSVRVPPRIYAGVVGQTDLVRLGEGTLPAVSPRGDLVAYVRDGALLVSPLDRLDERTLAPGLIVTERPAWSPDGTRIAVSVTNALAVVSVSDGLAMRNGRCDEPGCQHVSWSPDGTTLLYEESSLIKLLPANGGEVRTLVSGSDPAFSPDGRQIAFMAGDLFVMAADGSGPRRVAECTNNIPNTVTCLQPRWSSDGQRLSFNREFSFGRAYGISALTVSITGQPIEVFDGRDPQWQPGAALPAVRFQQRFGFVNDSVYWPYSYYYKLCFTRPCQPYPPGHGNVLDYDLSP